ncbi:hypothetical protein MGN70_012324 [Eutypa lata]|nr:hypothetical protein MGN70_012324 [Eutypa lata]
MLSHVVEAIHFGLQVEETVGMQLNSTRLDLPATSRSTRKDLDGTHHQGGTDGGTRSNGHKR